MNPFLVQAAAVGQGLNAAATGLNPAALSSLAGSGAGGLANPAAWAAAAAQLQAGDDLGGSGMSGCGIPGIPGFGAGNADAQHQVRLSIKKTKLWLFSHFLFILRAASTFPENLMYVPPSTLPEP